jgi:ABC-2 type transport system ATP-binding protein
VCGYDITKDVKKVSRVVGVVSFAEESFFCYLTVRQNLEFFAALYGFSPRDISSKVSNILRILDMEETANILFEELSRGMKQRLAIARGLLSSSQILFLDEPTKSLDPEIKVALRKVLREKAKQEGQTIFYITHDVLEARYFSDQVVMMEEGRVKLCDDYEKMMEHWQ